MSLKLTSCRPVAADDLRVRDYVTQMQVAHEIPSWFWSDDSSLQDPAQPVRYTCIPEDSGTPARVQSICLPFVYVKLPNGKRAMWDLRRCTLGRIDHRFARRVWQQTKRRRLRREARKARNRNGKPS